jgi:hypothetical protein
LWTPEPSGDYWIKIGVWNGTKYNKKI